MRENVPMPTEYNSGGLGSVTMRAVAHALGVVPMSLYTYVPGKAELLDLMLDTVYRQMPRGDLSGMPWRERLAAVAQANRDLFTLHPWIAEVSTSRPPLARPPSQPPPVRTAR